MNSIKKELKDTKALLNCTLAHLTKQKSEDSNKENIPALHNLIVTNPVHFKEGVEAEKMPKPKIAASSAIKLGKVPKNLMGLSGIPKY